MSQTKQKQTAILKMSDGAAFEGTSFGAHKSVAGEVVFNTGMVGYPETLTDPSYRGQIVVMSYPLIGNYGIPGDDRQLGLLENFESDQIHIQGLIVGNYCSNYSHWSAVKSLGDWMLENDIPGIYGVDTRTITQKLRDEGTMLGVIIADEELNFEDPNKCNLVKAVSVNQPIEYSAGTKKIILIDCGVKNNVIRALVKRDITVIRVPWDHPIQSERVDGIMISNGPGDPKMCRATIENIRECLKRNTPILGICLGSQILALAAGADTYKLKYGHRSQNQPCIEVGSKRCYITTQNHGYAILTESLPMDWREWFYNNNDETNEGIIHMSKPFFGTQFHPEASPGPDDTELIFDMFVRAIQ